MKIVVETADSLHDLLPEAADEGALEVELCEGASAGDALAALAIGEEHKVMLILNDRVVAKSDWSATTLRDGDTLRILPPLKGG